MIISNASGHAIHLGWYNQGYNLAAGATLTLSESYVSNPSFQTLLDAGDIVVTAFDTAEDYRYLVKRELTMGGAAPGADLIGYDHTTSGFAATTVQDAFDELASTAAGEGASLIGLDNTTSMLAATNVEAAFNEVTAGNKFYKGHVQTTDATVTPILSIPVAAGKFVGIEVHVVAYQAAGANSAFYEANILASDAAILGSDKVVIETAAGWDITFTFAGGNAIVNGSSGDAVTIDWTASATVLTAI